MPREIFKQFFNHSMEEMGEVVIFSCFDRLNDFKKKYKKHLIKEFQGYYKGITFEFETKRISVIYTGSGDSRVGDAVLALKGSACRAVIYTGTVGGIGDDINIGEIVAPYEAVIGEGFSLYYIKNPSPDRFKNISYGSTNMLEAAKLFFKSIKYSNYKVHFSKVFTIDSIFAETDELLYDMEKNKCTAVDMETSAFYTASSVIDIKCLAIHYVSDLPQKEKDYNMFKKACIRPYITMPSLLIDFVCENYYRII